MFRLGLLAGCLALGACASTRAIEVEINNQLGATPATLFVFEDFRDFPVVSGHTTARWSAPPGISFHRIEACLPMRINSGASVNVNTSITLSEDNPEGESAGTLRYRIQLRPLPEAGASKTPKLSGAPGVLYFDDRNPSPAGDAKQAADAARFNRAVEEAGSRAALGCWGGPIFAAMERANR